jgi:hypothetical protein
MLHQRASHRAARAILASRFAAMASRYGASASRAALVMAAENSPTIVMPRSVLTKLSVRASLASSGPTIGVARSWHFLSLPNCAVEVLVHARRHVFVVRIRDVFSYHLRVQEAVTANAAMPLVAGEDVRTPLGVFLRLSDRAFSYRVKKSLTAIRVLAGRDTLRSIEHSKANNISRTAVSARSKWNSWKYTEKINQEQGTFETTTKRAFGARRRCPRPQLGG